MPPTDPCVTNQIRLSLTSSNTEMMVSWATSNSSTPSPYAAVVRYGPATGPGAGVLSMASEPADSRSYSVCGALSPSLHAAVMTGLTPGAQYYYSIDSKACGTTPPAVFTAPRLLGDAATAYPFRMLAYADMGISNSLYTAALIAEKVASGNVDIIIHAGDICACEGPGQAAASSATTSHFSLTPLSPPCVCSLR